MCPSTSGRRSRTPSRTSTPNPIGTGPYTLHTCSGANIQYTKNDNYWQAGLPKIETVNFPSYLSNNAANADLASGADQWGSQYIPNIKAYYLSKNPNYHIWFEPDVQRQHVHQFEEPDSLQLGGSPSHGVRH